MSWPGVPEPTVSMTSSSWGAISSGGASPMSTRWLRSGHPRRGSSRPRRSVRALTRRAAELDVILLPGTRLEHGTPSAAGVDVVTSSETFSAGLLVNAAGLYADDVSAAVGGERFAIYVKGGAKVDHRGGGKLDHPAVEWRG